MINHEEQNGSGRILLVDDEKSITDLMYKLLEGDGYEVTTAINGYDGLTLFQNALRSFDLLITDCQMPDVGGVEFARACLRRNPDIGVLYMSGSHPDEELQSDMAAGRRAFLAKPFTWGDLLRKTKQLLSPSFDRRFAYTPFPGSVQSSNRERGDLNRL